MTQNPDSDYDSAKLRAAGKRLLPRSMETTRYAISRLAERRDPSSKPQVPTPTQLLQEAIAKDRDREDMRDLGSFC